MPEDLDPIDRCHRLLPIVLMAFVQGFRQAALSWTQGEAARPLLHARVRLRGAGENDRREGPLRRTAAGIAGSSERHQDASGDVVEGHRSVDPRVGGPESVVTHDEHVAGRDDDRTEVGGVDAGGVDVGLDHRRATDHEHRVVDAHLVTRERDDPLERQGAVLRAGES